MIGVDSNILIYAHNSGSPLYEESKQLIHKAIQEDGLGISELSLREFYAVITDGRKVERPFLSATASALLKNYIQSSKVSICKLTEEVWLRAFELCDRHNVARYQLDDILVAMTLCLNGVETVYTRNIRDFEQFEFIQAINPFRLSPMPSAPCVSRMIPYGRQSINERDVAAVCKVLRSDWLTQGPMVPRFEKAVSEYCGAQHGVAVNSGTSALHLACLALGVGPGDLVWTSPITFVASANCARYCGADVDFVDIDPYTYNLSSERLAEKLAQAKSAGRIPKVVIPVHFSGQPCNMAAIHELSKEYGFRIIEDACHAIGGRYKGEPIGNCRYSDITVFSFHPVKTLTTGEGGMILTNDDIPTNKCRMLRSHGITRDASRFQNVPSSLSGFPVPPPWYYEMQDLGYNYRISDIQCALGLSQMENLGSFVRRRREVWSHYTDKLKDMADFQVPVENVDVHSAWHLYVAQAHERDALVTFLHENGVSAHAMYIPIPWQPYYQAHFDCREGDFPSAEVYFKRVVILPLYPSLTDVHVEHVVTTVKKFYQR